MEQEKAEESGSEEEKEDEVRPSGFKRRVDLPHEQPQLVDMDMDEVSFVIDRCPNTRRGSFIPNHLDGKCFGFGNVGLYLV